MKLNKPARLELLLTIINNQNFSTIKQLATKIGVSEMTVRRDLQVLESENKIQSVYGGVTPITVKTKPIYTYTLSAEQSKNWNEKLLIAEYAENLIQPDDVVFMDSGSTVQALAEKIPNKYSYTFISSSLNTITVLAQLKNSTIITPGGIFSYKPKVFYDVNTVDAITKYRANICFIGATGYDLELGITCAYPEDAPMKQAMLDCSQEKILLIDSSKFGFVSTRKFADINQFSVVITDANIPNAYRNHIEDSGIKLVVVPSPLI